MGRELRCAPVPATCLGASPAEIPPEFGFALLGPISPFKAPKPRFPISHAARPTPRAPAGDGTALPREVLRIESDSHLHCGRTQRPLTEIRVPLRSVLRMHIARDSPGLEDLI